MSLLMDALKKAELAKRQGQGESAGSSPDGNTRGGLALELVPDESPNVSTANPPSAGNLPHLPSHLEELDAQFLAEAQQAASARLKAPPPTPVPDQAAATDTPPHSGAAVKPRPVSSAQSAPQNKVAAQNLFAAKQAEKPAARKGFAIAIGAITVLSVCGIGGYFWWQLQPKSASIAAFASRAPMPPPASSAPVNVPPPAPVIVPPPAPVAVASAPSPVPPVAGVAGAIRPSTPAAADKDDDSAPFVAKAQQPARRAIQAPAPAEPDGPIRVTKAPLKVNPALIRGFDAFNRGDLAAAQTEYERAQKSDPRNTDALHGLAAIAVRQGRADQAEWLYKQITEADPHDTVALSALINSRAQVDPGSAESKLKTLSAAQPELAAPYFSLGNLYARHGRWNDAQQAYFRAYSAEPENPDILYNLAISLEHLRQNKLAAQYYGQAIAAAQIRPAGFDKAQATARLNALQP
jgi:Flp pilus assembly protein TadD